MNLKAIVVIFAVSVEARTQGSPTASQTPTVPSPTATAVAPPPASSPPSSGGASGAPYVACLPGVYSGALCCAADVLGVADLDCWQRASCLPLHLLQFCKLSLCSLHLVCLQLRLIRTARTTSAPSDLPSDRGLADACCP